MGKGKSRPRGRPFPIHGSLGCSLWRLLYLFHLAGLPRRVEPRVKGAVQPEDREPALARDRLHPVRLLTRRCFGAEVKVDRAVSVGDQLVTLVIPAGERLRSLQRGARLRVIEHHRAESLCRNILRDVEPVVLCAVERLAAESALKKLPKELYKSR